MKLTHNAGAALSAKELAARAAKLQDSRKRLLDLTLRNRLLNFRAGDPNHKDDSKTHKHMVFKADVESVWSLLVEDEKPACITCLTKERIEQLQQEWERIGGPKRIQRADADDRQVALSIPPRDWERLAPSIRIINDTLQRGDLISLLPEEAFKKRANRIRKEQNSLSDSTGDSALFLAIGFLQWTEAPPDPKAGQPIFAPLVLLHVELQELRQEEGGERSYVLRMDGDQPQHNPCLAEKLREFNLELPVLEEGEDARTYLAKVRKAVKTKKEWAVSDGVALGFFNFARYRLWLDLNPDEWPEGKAPAKHAIVGSILDGVQLEQASSIPSDSEVARVQSEEDLLTVMDADSTQYAALLAAKRNTSMVVIGPPGSGKSQTITNLIAVALAEGKRVLFVAQKLAALQVVQRNLKKAGIAQFCLPLFSDQARVTEVHKHLSASGDARRNSHIPSRPTNSAAPVAQKLNGHAQKLALVPAGYTNSISRLIRNATALHLQAIELWGEAWTEELLSISTVDGEPSDTWLDSREQCLLEWHRLKDEIVGWGAWSPLELGAMDVGRVEGAAKRLQEAVTALATHCAEWPELATWPTTQLVEVAAQISGAGIRELNAPLPKLIAYLCESAANHANAARFERDLEELSRQRAQMQRILRVTPDTSAPVAARVGPASSILSGLLSPRCTLRHARQSLDKLVEVLQAAEDLLAQTAINRDGVASLFPGATKGDLQWRNLDLLAKCAVNPQVEPPANVKFRLAQYVREDAARVDKAKAFASEIEIDRQMRGEVTANIGQLAAWMEPAAVNELQTGLQICASKALGLVRLNDCPAIDSALQRLGEQLAAAACLTELAGKLMIPPTVSLCAELARLHKLTEPQMTGATAADWRLLERVAPSQFTAARIQEFADLVERSQTAFRDAQTILPRFLIDAATHNETLSLLQTSHQQLSELGLAGVAIASLPETLGNVRNIERLLGELLKSVTESFERWQLRPPAVIGDLPEARKLIRLLTSQPPVPPFVGGKGIATKPIIAEFWRLMQETQALAEFAKLYGSRIAFRDLPPIAEITQLRRELRARGSSLLRHLSPKYWQLRKQAGTFLNAPLPNDRDVINLLDKAEEYLQRSANLEQHPHNKTLGTDWKALEAYLHWCQEVISATGVEDVNHLVEQIKDNSAAKSLLVKLEGFITAIEATTTKLPTFVPLMEALGAHWPLGEGLEVLADANAKLARCMPMIEQVHEGHRDKLVSMVPQWVEKAAACCACVSSLKPFHDLIGDRQLVLLHGVAIRETGRWLAELETHHASPEVALAVGRREIAPVKLVQVVASATQVSGTLQELRNLIGCTPRWVAGAATLDGLRHEAESLRQAIGIIHTSAMKFEMQPHLTMERCEELARYTTTLHQLAAAFTEWETLLGERPTGLAAADILDTLKWLAELRSAGAGGAFLSWLLAGETRGRIAWWVSTVSRTRSLQARVREIQDDFLAALHQPDQSLEMWVEKNAEQLARLSAALETAGALCHADDTELQDLSASVTSLNRSLELVERLRPWTEALDLQGEATAAKVAAHRHWVAASRAIPALFGNWLTSQSFAERTSKLNLLPVLVRRADKATTDYKACLSEHGPVTGAGPFAVLDKSTTLEGLGERLNQLLVAIPALPSFAAMLREHKKAHTLGLGPLLSICESARPSSTTLIATFRAAVAWQQAKSVWQADDSLRLFRSSQHEQLRRKFQEADELLMLSNRKHIADKLAVLDVTHGAAGKSPKDLSELQLLNHEMGKKRKHIPIRKLVQRAGRAMLDLCPCWMMTPLAVAQFLPAGEIDFDLIIMDEASQLHPEDAWGAIARGKQLVVVGDPKQMPPSDFFASTFEDDESEDPDEVISGGKAESILEAATSSLPLSWLEWHYRSRHESLIAPANQFSYANKLILYPNPHRKHPELGVRYAFADDAQVTTGRVTNPVEAQMVAARLRELVLLEHRRAQGQRKSIGVVAMNMHQQECIQDLVDNLRRSDTKFDQACMAMENDAAEPLFIKNLENIQGDERDVMLISCTYGPHTVGGTPTQRFGPLNREGGERRFNVLITRAKWRMEVFASLKSQQVLIDGKKQGVSDFHFFLRYAETGHLADEGRSSRRTHDSPFEAQVDAILQKAGYTVEPQVGVAGYYIDLAIRHPGDPGRFVIGIECDGATYHSSRAARDRDRLRERVLMERGWQLHRIWSTDWFTNQKQAREKLLRAIADACRQP